MGLPGECSVHQVLHVRHILHSLFDEHFETFQTFNLLFNLELSLMSERNGGDMVVG